MYKKIKGYYPKIINYFPEYSENPEYLPPKKYMWDIFSTKDSSMANKFISHSLKEKNLKDSEGERMLRFQKRSYTNYTLLTISQRRKVKHYLWFLLQKNLEQSNVRERNQ